MIESNDGQMQSELIRILEEQHKPLNLEAIFNILYNDLDQVPGLVALTRERCGEMKRLKRSLDQSVYRGLVQTSWDNGQIHYIARQGASSLSKSSFQLSIVRENDRLSFTARPNRFHVVPNWDDRLLVSFCVIALVVLASMALFLAAS